MARTITCRIGASIDPRTRGGNRVCRSQGIPRDRSDRGVIYGIVRASAGERKAGGTRKIKVCPLVEG